MDMFYRLAADAIVILHMVFVIFVVAGGLLVCRWRWVVWLHIPAVIWAVLLEFYGWLCPLTPLEINFRAAAGQAGYGGGFIEHYILPVLYPVALDAQMQAAIGGFVIVVNIAVYSWVVLRLRKAEATRKSFE